MNVHIDKTEVKEPKIAIPVAGDVLMYRGQTVMLLNCDSTLVNARNATHVNKVEVLFVFLETGKLDFWDNSTLETLMTDRILIWPEEQPEIHITTRK